MKSHAPRWPTSSPGPLVNILATGVLVIFGFLAFATSFFLLVPVAIGFVVIGLLRWYHHRPPRPLVRAPSSFPTPTCRIGLQQASLHRMRQSHTSARTARTTPHS